jgi:parallel beta-helix repeat protein
MDDSESAPQAPEDIGTGQQPPENTPTEQMPGPSQPEGQEPQPQEETVSPQEQTTPQPTYAEPTPKPRLNLSLPRVNPRIIGAVIAVLVIGILIFKFAPAIITPTTTTTTTVKPIGLNKINSCVTISQPGTYYIISDINTSLLKGPCIKINASSVWLVGNQHTITGNGPYTGVPPFSYGIEIQGGKNDTITNVKVLRFSYDLFLNGSSSSVIGLNNFTQATLSGIYFLNSYNNTIEQNYIAGSVSRQGGIYLSSGGKNRFLNNSVVNNYYYGIVINSSNNNFTHNNFGSNGADLVCNQNTAPKNTNIFAGSTCRVNDYCAFASCSTNIPLNLSLVRLSEGSVNNCGTIYSPGNYTLAKSLSTSAYVSSSNPLANKMPCIQILAPNVNFNCKNKQISNSGYAIYMRGTANANVTDCVFYNDTYGIDAVTSYNPLITNALAINDTYGIYLNNATSGKV